MTVHEDARPGASVRLETLIRHRNHYSLVNALLKRGNDAGLRALGYTDAQIAKLREPDAKGRTGYALSLTNIRHRIRRQKRKLKGTL